MQLAGKLLWSLDLVAGTKYGSDGVKYRSEDLTAYLVPCPRIMKISVFPVAIALVASSSLASAQSTIQLRQHDARGDSHQRWSLEHEVERMAAKYAKNAQMYFKNTGKHHSVVNGTTLARRSNSGKVGMGMVDGSRWVGEIEIGSPGQKQGVAFDTGSPNIIIGRGSYRPDDSSTSKSLGKLFETDFLGPSVQGSLYSDEVNVGGVKAKHVVLGSSDADFMNKEGVDDESLAGVFGLSFPSIGDFGISEDHTFVGAAKKQKIFYDNVYQFFIRKNGDSYLNVGKVNKERLDGEVGWVDVDSSDGYWKAEVEMNGHKANGIVDSGTTFIFGNNDDVKKVLDDIDGVEVKKSDSGDWQGWYKCDSPPEVKIKVAGKEVKMEKDAMVAGVDNDQCQLTIAGVHGVNSWIFGESFFEMYSIIFDFGKERMGFAKTKD